MELYPDEKVKDLLGRDYKQVRACALNYTCAGNPGRFCSVVNDVLNQCFRALPLAAVGSRFHGTKSVTDCD